MSYRSERVYSSTGIDFKDQTAEQVKNLFRETIEDGIHGLCFSAYEEGQQPGDILTEEQVRRRMAILAPHTKWIRSFSCIEGNELIPKIAKEFGLKTLVGAWLGTDKELNEKELTGMIELANAGYVDIAAVGNEVLYRGDLTEDELLEYIGRVRAAVPKDIPVSYVDAYYEFSIKPRVVDACDVILANCYPYWEGSSIDYAHLHMKQMYYQAAYAAKGKKVIITETGWPSEGSSLKGAQPSTENFIKYFVDAQQWSAAEGIEMFYFSSFDESWKVGAEGDVGAYWGLWDKHEEIKF